MLRHPHNRMVHSGATSTRRGPVVGVQRASATVRDILNREASGEDIITGHSEIIHLAKRASKFKNRKL